jgi:hypothetical protein
MVKIEGLAALNRKFRAMPVEVRRAIEKSVPAAGAELAGMVKRLAPTDKGNLRDSVRVEPEPGAEGFGVLVIAGGTPATKREVRQSSGVVLDEALMVEDGTKPHRNKGRFAGSWNPGVKARPFFFPAYRALKKLLRGRMSRAMSEAIKKVARS